LGGHAYSTSSLSGALRLSSEDWHASEPDASPKRRIFALVWTLLAVADFLERR
jgi:tryptophan-rich sensory protein